MLDELEDQINQANDQDADLNKVRDCDHCHPPFLGDRGVKKRPPIESVEPIK